MKKLNGVKLVVMVFAVLMLISCAASQPTESPVLVMTIDGATEVIDDTQDHPCKGNWNFCDQVMDDLDTFYVPAF